MQRQYFHTTKTQKTLYLDDSAVRGVGDYSKSSSSSSASCKWVMCVCVSWCGTNVRGGGEGGMCPNFQNRECQQGKTLRRRGSESLEHHAGDRKDTKARRLREIRTAPPRDPSSTGLKRPFEHATAERRGGPGVTQTCGATVRSSRGRGAWKNTHARARHACTNEPTWEHDWSN